MMVMSVGFLLDFASMIEIQNGNHEEKSLALNNFNVPFYLSTCTVR